MRRLSLSSFATAQSGMSLFPALMFLLVLSVLGMSVLNSTLLQEKMAGNTKDTNVAFQAGEAGLRDAEADIALNVTAGTVFTSSCTNGLCTPPSTWPTPLSTDISKVIDWTSSANTRVYGSQTSAPALADVAAPPLYVIEKLSSLPVGPGSSIGLGVTAPTSGGTAYRLTVLATGMRPETRVVLQSTFLVSSP
ncbi:MAG TPA: PilX N-terminal domain-containing pilus assembly protein [Casimicrobiaceae bacterium]|nr:PilX N-terminal domain-containing pilus assembly protein [Casimicrobiaceae bacterium]